MPVKKQEAHRALELLEDYHARLSEPQDRALRIAIERVIRIFKSRLFQALLDIQEFYELTLLDDSKSIQQKTAETLQIATKWEKDGQAVKIADFIKTTTTNLNRNCVYEFTNDASSNQTNQSALNQNQIVNNINTNAQAHAEALSRTFKNELEEILNQRMRIESDTENAKDVPAENQQQVRSSRSSQQQQQQQQQQQLPQSQSTTSARSGSQTIQIQTYQNPQCIIHMHSVHQHQHTTNTSTNNNNNNNTSTKRSHSDSALLQQQPQQQQLPYRHKLLKRAFEST